VLDYGGEAGILSLVASHREDKTLTRERVTMKLDEVETLKDLKEWVKENMPKAEVYEDMYGTLVIRTGLESTMGGYLSPIEREGE
jgi:hypothetical protein